MAKTANQKIKAALATGGNNKLTNSEIRNLTQAGIGVDKILTVAAKNNAVIGQRAQDAYGVDQNKKGVISYTPAAAAPGASMFGGVTSTAPKPGSGWAVTGIAPQGTPTYTYMGPVKTTPSSPSQSPGGFTMSGANDQGLPPPPGSNPGTTPGGPGTTTTAPTTNWWDSIVTGINGVLTTINNQIDTNNKNQELYMGDIQNLISQMTTTPAPQTIAPYAVTTTTNAPAQGAQLTQAISRRLKNLNTSLAIAPATTASAGTGLNIAV